MAKKTGLEEYQNKINEALALLDSETADAIIGSPPPDEYNILIQATDSAYKLLWSMCKSNGMRQTPSALKMGAQAMGILATLVHYAFALGVRYGRGDAEC